VGNQFVTQYYTVLHKQPHFLHRFYTDHSTMTYSEPGSTEALLFNTQKVSEHASPHACCMHAACASVTCFLHPMRSLTAPLHG